MTAPMTSIEVFLFLQAETDRPPSASGPSSYDEMAEDVAAVRRYYVDRGWLTDAYAREDLDELCSAYVSDALARMGGEG